jgi:GTP cyclohydrolase II
MLVIKAAESALQTRSGAFRIHIYRECGSPFEHTVLTAGVPNDACLVRVHSECTTGDVFGSLRCDCADQLAEALRLIAKRGAGVLIYLRGHEGRGIGLSQKIAAYALQDEGLDTAQANHRLGFPTDTRRYDAAVSILCDLGLDEVRLITNNPDKIHALEAGGIRVVERVPIWTAANPYNHRYLETKRALMGHLCEGATPSSPGAAVRQHPA